MMDRKLHGLSLFIRSKVIKGMTTLLVLFDRFPLVSLPLTKRIITEHSQLQQNYFSNRSN